MQRLVLHRRLKNAQRLTPRRKQRGVPVWSILVAFNLLVFSVVGCSGALVGGGVGAVYAFNTIKQELPKPEELGRHQLAQVTQLYDRTGQHLLYEFYDERRIAIPLDDVAPMMVLATLAIEDANFYVHRGFDPRGILRAAFDNLRSQDTVSGASTITQQLVKRMLLSDEQTYVRKLRELILATEVEQRYSKDQILEMYFNQVYYGNQAYGVESAARSYFGKHAKDLTLAESSLLAGLVQLPSRYDPVTNREAAFARQRQVLDAMARNGYISQEQADAAAQEAQGFSFRMQESRIRYPHFSFYAKEQLLKSLGPELVRNGLKVTTTLDIEMQERAQSIVKRRIDEIRWQKVNNGALVALDPRSGQVWAMVGSYDYYKEEIDGKVNVTTAPRQPGSSFKPFTYATAFATKRYFPATPTLDEPVALRDLGSPGGLYRPMNYDLRWHGTISLRAALANSYNIPALLLQDAVGTPELIKTARKLGITTDLPAVPSLTLGAGTVKLIEMTGAYATFANLGVRHDVTPFLKIETLDGAPVWELGQPEGDREIWPTVSYMISDILADRAVRRPAFGNVLDLAENRTAAVKTGTTNDYKDSWTIGYTPSLTVGVWVGNTDNSPMLQVAGSLGAGYIWKDFMDQTLAGRPDEPFPVPAGIVRGPICPDRPQAGSDLFIDSPPGECPETLRAPDHWRAGMGPRPPAPPTPTPARR